MFLFKKIAPPFLDPVPLCLELLLLGLVFLWFTRRQRAGKILVSLATGLLLVCSYAFFPNLALRPLEQKYPPVSDSTAAQTQGHLEARAGNLVVVLGGGIISDPRLPLTSQIRADTLYRLLEGVRLYRAAPGRKLILSGGKVFSSISEAQIMARVARIMGVPSQDIMLEPASRDTEEEARFIKPLVGREKFFLVTSASHLPRSMAMFQKQGMAPVPAPAGYRVAEADGLTPIVFFPSSRNLEKVGIALHEYLGLAWAWLRGEI